MARDGVAVDARLAAAVARAAAGEPVRVARVCRELDVSRTTFYKYLGRFVARGVDGFFPDSRRPRRVASVVDPWLEDAIVTARKRLGDAGLDVGAISVLGWLGDHREWWPADVVSPGPRLPSRATVHRVLVRRGQVIPAPKKRPRHLYRRFEDPKGNGLWQADGFEVDLADGTTSVVIQFIDDHTRLDLVCHAARSENALDVWTAFSVAAARYGLPARLLTDNGSAFSGKRRGWSSALETGARLLGVQPICSTPRHPQTCGKGERAHGTVLRWLAKRPAATDLGGLQVLLDEYREIYNSQRRHQALNGLTPTQAWAIAERSGPHGHPLTAPLQVSQHRVSSTGRISVDGHLIGLGRRYAGQPATVFLNGDDVTVFTGTQLARQLVLDRRCYYQPQPAPAITATPAAARSGQRGAPAAQRGRTTLTATSKGGPL